MTWRRQLPAAGRRRSSSTINGVRRACSSRAADARTRCCCSCTAGRACPSTSSTGRPHGPRGRLHGVLVGAARRRASRTAPTSRPESMTMEQLIGDTIAVTDYLRERFAGSRIYLLGHSWGSFLGIQVAARAPERYHAYIGMGQVADQQQSEVLAYEYELDAVPQGRETEDGAHARGGAGHHGRAAAGGVHEGARRGHAPPRRRHDAGHEVGRHRRVRARVADPGYTLREKADIWRGKAFARGVIGTSSRPRTYRRGDRNSSCPLLLPGQVRLHRACTLAVLLRQARAPVKGFYTFEHSAHSPAFEEPGR